MKKTTLSFQNFYISIFTKTVDAPYLVFIHGGPGYNCGVLEYLIQHERYFTSLAFNLVFYDQRNCGRSIGFSSTSHTENVNDLKNIYQYLSETLKMKIIGFMGHSYGAKLLFDFYKKFDAKLPAIFISTAKNILTPRLNNLTLDLTYLKKTNLKYYQELINPIQSFDFRTVWELSEKLESLFQLNPDRPYFYWANLDVYRLTLNIQSKINLPPNQNTLLEVRRELYDNIENCHTDIPSLDIPYLWVNGFHDYIMNGAEMSFSEKNSTTFFHSAHFPHLEENEQFCQIVNIFLINYLTKAF